jgi:hypothetical protein
MRIVGRRTAQRGWRMHPMSRWSLTLLMVGSACSEPTRDIFSVDGIIQGTVRTGAGNPVADAWIAVEGSYPLGVGNSESLYDSVRTDASGRYIARVGVLNLPDTVATLTIRVWPPASSGFAPVARSDLEVRVTADLPPRDTLKVDFTLQPS